jgi:outer membrane protein assembly factor BamB
MSRAVRIQRSRNSCRSVCRCRTVLACCVLLLLSADYTLADGGREHDTGSLHGPIDFLQQNLIQSAEEARLLASAKRNLQGGDTDAAFVALLQIFSQPHDAFTPIFSGKPSHSTYRSALALLQTAELSTRAAWTQATEVLAAQALHKAAAGGTVEELRGVSQSYPFTRSGMEALALRARLALGRGQRRLAGAVVREMEYLATTAVSFPTADLLKQFRDPFVKHADDAASLSNTVSAVGQTDVPQTLALPWPTPLWKWQESVWKYPQAAITLSPLLQPEHRRELAANSWSPVITSDAVILRTPFRIVSFTRTTGDINWFLPTDTVPEDIRLEDTDEFSLSSRGTIAHLLSREELGSMAVDNGFLFFIDHFHDLGNRFVRQRISAGAGLIPGGFKPADMGRSGTRLVAVKVKPQPHVSWTVGGPEFEYRMNIGEDDDSSVQKRPLVSTDESNDSTRHDVAADVKSDFHGQRFLGTPLPYDQMLFVLSTDEEIVWLSCLTQATGRTIWQRPLTYENAPVPTRRSRIISVEQSNGISLCGVQGDTLICAVNSGIVIGTQLVDGQFKWATSIRDADKSSYSARTMLLSRMSSPSSSGFQPLFRDRKMVWASDYSTMVHCLDTDSGKVLWRADRNVKDSGLMEGSRDRYAVAVLQNRAVLVGNGHVRALSMNDGQQLWSTPIQKQTGRGTCNAEYCLIPLQDGTVTQIDVQTGRANSMSQAVIADLSGAALGSLVADDDIICAATPLSVSVLPTIQTVSNRTAQGNAPTSRERLVTAQTQLLSADLKAGVTSLQSLLNDEAVGPRANRILAETLLQVLAEDRFRTSSDDSYIPAATEILDDLSLSEEQQIRRFLLGSVREPSVKQDSARRPLLPLLPLLPNWHVRADVVAWSELSADRAPIVAPFSPDDEPRLSFATIEHAILFPHQLGDVSSQISFANRLADSHYPTAAHLFLQSAAEAANEADRLLLENTLPAAPPVMAPTGNPGGSQQQSGPDTAEGVQLNVKIEETPLLSSGSRLVSVLSMEKGTVETPDWFSDRLFRTSRGIISVNMDIGTISAPAGLPVTAEAFVLESKFQSAGVIPLKDDRHVGVFSLVANEGPSLLWWKQLDRSVSNQSRIEIGPTGPGYMVVATGNQVSCLHTFTGSLLWRQTLSSDITRRTAFGEAARVIGDEQIVGVLGKNLKSCQLFRTKDGKRLEVIRLDIPDGQTPLVYGRMVLFHKDQRLVLIDVLSGNDVMDSAAPVDIRSPGMAELLPRGRAVAIADNMDLVVVDLQTGRSDIRCSLKDHLDTNKITGLKAFEHLNRLFVLLKNWDHSHRNLSNTSRMGETRLESGTLICIDQEAGKILWSRPTVPSVLAEIHGDPTELLVTWSWNNHQFPFQQRQIGGQQIISRGNNRSQSGRSLVVSVIDGQTGATLTEKEFSSFSTERDEPVRFLNDTDSSTICIETVRSSIVISYGR